LLHSGLFDLSWWGVALAALALTHVTIAAVTIFLHRHQAHRALTLKAPVSHFFRFWLWLTTGMVTREWVAVHRKHHAKCETAEDPHSPQVLGIHRVLWGGALLYQRACRDRAALEQYGRGTPDDWIEQRLYTPHNSLGILLMALIDIALFGVLSGIAVFVVQMLWIPLWAAGVINGVGHFWGYRNFASRDASVNIAPWGILIGGEELHNNHHAYAGSAKLALKWYEFDIGWVYIRLLQFAGLARVRKVAPQLKMKIRRGRPDAEALQAILTHRCEVMASYAKALQRTCLQEAGKLRQGALHAGEHITPQSVKRWLQLKGKPLRGNERRTFQQTLARSAVLHTVYAMREELGALWTRSTASKEQLLGQLEDWCRRADDSGIEALRRFSRRLRCYA